MKVKIKVYQLGFGVYIYNDLRNLLSPIVRALATIAPTQQLHPHPRHEQYIYNKSNRFIYSIYNLQSSLKL